MKKQTCLVFYAGQFYGEFDHMPSKFEHPEIYEGAYVYQKGNEPGWNWWRCDYTPLHDDEIPKELKVWQILLM